MDQTANQKQIYFCIGTKYNFWYTQYLYQFIMAIIIYHMCP